MTYVDSQGFRERKLVKGRAYDQINRLFHAIASSSALDAFNLEGKISFSEVSARESALRSVQDYLSSVSMHLPPGFAQGLKRQFANLMSEDAWEDDDDLVGLSAVAALVKLLIDADAKKRPSIGTNGRGSVTASWNEGDDRLTIDFHVTGRIVVLLSRTRRDGSVERAAFDAVTPDRVLDLLVPFDPGVWFDKER